jgi:hypothetical protein
LMDANAVVAAVRARDATRLAATVVQLLGGEHASAAELLRAAAREATSSESQNRSCTEARKESNVSFVTLSGLSLAAPRGRFDVVLGSAGVLLRAKGGAVVHGPISWDGIAHVLKVPKPETYRKFDAPARAYYVVLVFGDAVRLVIGKQELQCVVFNADGAKPLPNSTITTGDASQASHEHATRVEALAVTASAVASEAEHVALARLFAACFQDKKCVTEPDRAVCIAESLRAYRGVDEGALYPLRPGLLFLPKPALFIPTTNIAGLSQGGPGSASIADIVVQLRNATAEGDKAKTRKTAAGEAFSNIAKHDLELLAEYVRFAHRSTAAAAGGGVSLDAAADSAEDEEDGDFDPNVSDCDNASDDKQDAGMNAAASSSDRKQPPEAPQRQRQSKKHCSSATLAAAPVAKRTRRALAQAGLSPVLPADIGHATSLDDDVFVDSDASDQMER